MHHLKLLLRHIAHGLLLNQGGHQSCPAGLVAGPKAHTAIAMEKFMEQYLVVPIGMLSQKLTISMERSAAGLIVQEETDQPL